MNAYPAKREREEIRALAESYRSRGYSIVPLTPSEGVPPEIIASEPDLVVRNKDETVVVEVKGSTNARNIRLTDLAEQVARYKGWRLEFVWLGNTTSIVPSRPQIREVVSRARRVAELDPAAALLLAWAAAESALDLLINEVQSESSTETPPYRSTKSKVSLADSLGVISEAQYEVLSEAAELRNSVAHSAFFDLPDDLEEIVESVLDTVTLISREGFTSVDQMIDWFHEIYKDPDEGVPYITADGGYQYVAGGPYDAREIIEDNFPDSDPQDKEQVVGELESESTIWVKREDY